MQQYYINPNYVVNQTEKYYTIFTEKVDKVFLLQEVESEILFVFSEPKSIDAAVEIIADKFTRNSFNEAECRQYINELIENKILIC